MTQHPGSVYVDVDVMPWQATPFPGIEIKMLYEQSDGEGFTALFRAKAGAKLPLHRHRGVEQTYIIEGSLVDDEGTCTAGNFVWRRPGSVHEAYTPDGLLGIGIFQQPNEFLDTDHAETDGNDG
tara:strand:- start:349 stop:720 length:372 start_codon:yes stop_codon:yes gene_type:complete